MSPKALELLSFDNEVYRAFLFHSAILVVKMLLMAPLTARQRYAKKIFISPEDTKLVKGSKAGLEDPDIERVRRAHRNDLENILIYFMAAFGYIMTNPAPGFAILLMRAFTVARVAHTIVYAVFVVPQPARAIAFFVGYFVTAYMALMTILKFAS